MAYPFANSLEAKSWLRGYCVRHDMAWADMQSLCDRSVGYNAGVGKWLPFASKLYWAEIAEGTRKPRSKQPTLKPSLGPILTLLQRMTSEDELRDFLATILFDEIVEIATAVKQKRSSRGKRVQGKARQVQARPGTGDAAADDTTPAS